MSYSVNYQYQYSINCAGDIISDYFSCNRNSNFCRNGTDMWLSNNWYVFSNSILSSTSNSNPSCSDLSLVATSVSITCSTDSGGGYYSDCTITSGGDSTGTIPDIPGGNEPSATPPAPYNGNIIESVSGATVILDDSALASGVGEPMFFWYGQLLNVAIKFFPVIIVVSMFRLIYGYLKNLGNKNSLESKKSLDNK